MAAGEQDARGGHPVQVFLAHRTGQQAAVVGRDLRAQAHQALGVDPQHTAAERVAQQRPAAGPASQDHRRRQHPITVASAGGPSGDGPQPVAGIVPVQLVGLARATVGHLFGIGDGERGLVGTQSVGFAQTTRRHDHNYDENAQTHTPEDARMRRELTFSPGTNHVRPTSSR